MFMDDNDKLIDVAHRESAYLHDLGLFDASTALDELLKQRAELLAALKIADKFCGSLTSDECPDSVHIPIRDAITKAEAAE